MAKKHTKAEKLQRNVERLANRDEACREKFAITGERFEPTGSPTCEEEIRLRAYELYEARGREDGHEVDDWLQAEAEITGVLPKAGAA